MTRDEYINEIIKCVKEVNNVQILNYLYTIIKLIVEKWG